jgi:hypothetical protein
LTQGQGTRIGDAKHDSIKFARSSHFCSRSRACPLTLWPRIGPAVTARKPRTRHTIGRDTALRTLVARILPDRILDRVFAAALRLHFPKESK